MHAATAKQIKAERHADRIASICEAFEDAAPTLEFRLDQVIDTLVNEGCVDSGFSGSLKRTELCKRLAWEVLRKLAVSEGIGLPDEAQWVLFDSREDAKELGL